ncbi:het-s domain protein [Diplodia corticola]|uniref:Het-s domain protein n=1 Tax=Diplodia corticola TaxID=236234 RepID=A0A1J9QWG6_9PEZI|nr:het-s domain protein [Diplodia corticola]OJD32346.1 het-s domain protein [Diplodia corticola]
MSAFAHLPRRLTKLYADTKQDINDEQAKLENVPELNALHRRFRIQRDRLIAWGLEWSDNSSAASQGSIDESVAQAGLTETVTSVLGTIQDILDEADRIRDAGGQSPSDTKKPSSPSSWTPADKSRYEDLARDLTTSIDTLYDLSRARRISAVGTPSRDTKPHLAKSESLPSTPFKTPFLDDDYTQSSLTLVSPPTVSASSTIETESVPKIDPSCLILPEEEPPPYESIGVPSCTRLIGHFRRSQSSTNPWRFESGDVVTIPVLIEYAGFDPVYRMNELSPPLERVENLLDVFARGVGRFGEGSDAPAFGTLKCVGYFEDLSQPRFGFVFELPGFVYGGITRALRPAEFQAMRPVTLLSVLQSSAKNNVAVPNIPALEKRFRIALNLVLSFSKLHASGFVHKDVNSSNILLFRKPKEPGHSSKHPQYELQSPYVCSFDLFSEFNVEVQSTGSNIYRHPHDPRAQTPSQSAYAPHFDMYGLALILLEIGLWIPLLDIFKAKYTLADFKLRLEDIWIRRLAGKCGTAYMQAVRECFSAADRHLSSTDTKVVYDRVLGRLHRCTLLDDADPYPYDLGHHLTTSPSPSPSLLKRAHDQGLGMKRAKLQKRNVAEFTERFPHEHSKPLLAHGEAVEGNPELTAFLSLSRSPESGLRGGGEDLAPERHKHGHDIRSHSREALAPVDAAKIIQRAWRRSHGKMTFREYRKRVAIIQTKWREKKARLTSASQEEQPPMLHRAVTDSYPAPAMDITIDEINVQTSIKLKQQKSAAKRKLLVQPLWRPTPSIAAEWDQTILPRLMRICERVLRDSPESSSIDLFGIGPSPSDAKATIVVTCASTAKVKAALAKKFSYDRAAFDLKVHKGKIKRSKLTRSTRRRRAPYRSMMDEDDEIPALNGCFQQRPVCGASIGAYNGEHLPPVSYGGVVLVDGEPFGMSVHHMLDTPSEDESEYGDEYSDVESEDVLRSSAKAPNYNWTSQIGSQPLLHDLPDIPQAFEISDDEDFDDGASSYAYDSADEDFSDSESEATSSEPGDIPGIEAGDGEEILITQPAIDDVEDDFFPCEEDRDEDHLDSHELGHVHASSGIRRWNRDGVVHEIDWSLLKLKDERLQPYNLIQGGKRYCVQPAKLCPKLVDPVDRRHSTPEEDEYPSQVAKAEDLGSLQVHSLGRTSGLKGGIISHTMTAVKIHGRKSYARSWHVSGGLGVGGDSGAWVIDNEHGRICGHVLAWCDRNHVAYICPMQVLLEDIKRTLGAKKVLLPGQQEENAESFTSQAKGGFDLPDIKQLSIGDVDGGIRSRFMQNPSKIEVVRGRAGQMA